MVTVALFLFGFTSAFNILVLAHGRRLFPDEIAGQALSTINLFMFVGIFLLQWLIGVIIGLFTLDSGGGYPPQAYTIVLLATAVCNTVAVIVYFPFTKEGSASTHSHMKSSNGEPSH